jgi:hypothetical protein
MTTALSKPVFRRSFLRSPFFGRTIEEIALDFLERSAVWIFSGQKENQLRYAESTTLRQSLAGPTTVPKGSVHIPRLFGNPPRNTKALTVWTVCVVQRKPLLRRHKTSLFRPLSIATQRHRLSAGGCSQSQTQC